METVSHEYALPADFVPDNLVDISDEVKTNGIACLSAEVVPVLKEMFAAAKEDGVDLMVTSAYRSPEIQEYLYNFWIHVDGEKAYKEVAKPGHSEHQLGTTVDLTDVSIGYAGVSPLFEVSDGGLWLQSNAHKYGFIMSYPKVNEKTQAYSFEPWHWRYVGTYTAEKMQKERLKHEN